MSHQVIRTTDGAIEYSWPTTVTETSGVNISGDTIQISLGTYNDPGTWVAGVVTHPTTSTATIKLLIDGTTPPGTFWVWVRVTDTPEVVPRRGARITVI